MIIYENKMSSRLKRDSWDGYFNAIFHLTRLLDRDNSCTHANSTKLVDLIRCNRALEEATERKRKKLEKIFVMAKPVDHPANNRDYLGARWKTFCIQDNIVNRREQINREDATIASLKTFQIWIVANSTLRRNYLSAIISMDAPNDMPQVTHLRAQILLVWKDYGMRSVMLMNDFISSGCQAIEIPVTAREAATFFRVYRELSDHYGDRFSYTRIFPLPHIERIDHGNYINLYKAAVTWENRSGAFGQNDSKSLMSNVNATVSDQILADYFARGIRRMAGIDDVTRGHLEAIGCLALCPSRVFQVDLIFSPAKRNSFS